VSAVETLVGDRAPNKAFAGFGLMGSIVPRPQRSGLIRQLGLNASQNREASAIYDQLHEEIRGWQNRAQAAIRERLGADDAALSEFLRHDAQRGVSRFPNRLFGRLMEAFKIEGEKQARIVAELALMRTQVQRAHQFARDRFISLLSADQWDELQQFERPTPPAAEDWRREVRLWSFE
jgi:hypothetical protein